MFKRKFSDEVPLELHFDQTEIRYQLIRESTRTPQRIFSGGKAFCSNQDAPKNNQVVPWR